MNMLHMKGDCWNLLNDVKRELRLAEADIHSNTTQLEEMLMLWDNEAVTDSISSGSCPYSAGSCITPAIWLPSTSR